MSDIVHAFLESPQYERGAMFVNYDEWGGFFDHVAPPHVPDDRGNRKDLAEDWSLCGFRVPGIAISPFTKGGGVSHMTVTHESILKLISYRFGLGYLNCASSLRVRHRPQLRLRQPRPGPGRAPRPVGDRRDAVRARRRQRLLRGSPPRAPPPLDARDQRPARPARLRGPAGDDRPDLPQPRLGPQGARVLGALGGRRGHR